MATRTFTAVYDGETFTTATDKTPTHAAVYAVDGGYEVSWHSSAKLAQKGAKGRTRVAVVEVTEQCAKPARTRLSPLTRHALRVAKGLYNAATQRITIEPDGSVMIRNK